GVLALVSRRFRDVLARRRWLIAALVLGGASAVAAFVGRNDESRDRPAERPVPVGVVTATKGELALYLIGLGTATAANTVLVKSRVDGQLLRVHFDEGQTVRAGDLLAEIDPRPFQVQLLQAEGQLARDQALLKNAQVDLERYRMLWSQDSIAKQLVDAQDALVRQYEGTVRVERGGLGGARLPPSS